MLDSTNLGLLQPRVILIRSVCIWLAWISIVLFLIWGACHLWRILKRPLSSFPGPLAAKVTNLWLDRIKQSGLRHLEDRKAHQTFGDVVRIGYNELSFVGCEALNDIYQNRRFLKTTRYDSSLQPSVFDVTDVTDHARRRKALAPGCGATAFREFEPSIIDLMSQWSERLSPAIGATHVDMSTWIDFLITDMVA